MEVRGALLGIGSLACWHSVYTFAAVPLYILAHIYPIAFFSQPRQCRPKFRLEINSTVVWLYAGSVSLILPDV